MDAVEQVASVAAPVVPTSRSTPALLPCGQGDVRLRPGLLYERQQTNRDVTIRHGLREMERAGALENFRIAAGQSAGERRGMVFSDSDVYKWLEAVAWEIGREPSDELAALAAEVIAVVTAAQQADGYLNTYCQLTDPSWRWSDLEMGHELYCAGHLIQAAIAWTRATGDESLLGFARRFADLIDDEFRLGAQTGTDGHPEIEMALVELYRLTDEPRYLTLAGALTERRGQTGFSATQFDADYYQQSTSVRESSTIVGHAVRALYLLSGVTDLAVETHDDELMDVVTAQWDDLVSRKLYLTGGIGSRHFGEAIGDPYELPPDRAYCETCAAIASIMWNWRMLVATGDVRYADLVERTLYNGFLSGTSADGKSFFYVNPLQSRGRHRPRAEWDPVACCPPNIMRLLACLQQYVATYSEEGIQIHQYTSATIEPSGPGARPVALRMATGYPWSGRIELEVTAADDLPWTLQLRIPSWASGATVDGAPATPGAYVEVSRRWRVGDRVIVELDMAPRVVAPHPRIDAIRGCLAIERGPLVYCIEGVDLPPEVDMGDIVLADDPSPRALGKIADLDEAPAVGLDAEIPRSHGWGEAEYRDVTEIAPAGAPRERLELTAVPYFLWGNRDIGGPMRVWIPQQTMDVR